MSHNAEHYVEQLKALLPIGRVWDSLRESVLFTSFAFALSDEFSRIDDRTIDLMAETDPRTTLELLDEWEGFAGLPDSCLGALNETLQARRDSLVARLTDTGGQSKPYFIARAKELGHDITITEAKVSIAGVMVAGDSLVPKQEHRHAWKVNVPIENTYAFVAGSSVAGDSLGYWQPIRLECLFERIKPATSFITWNYTT